jgi:glycosyltransferase involved in cell wall biosynthesis
MANDPAAHLSIVHFADSDLSGGAAKAGFRLHTALRQAGHRSRMVVGAKYSEDDGVHRIEPYLDPWRSRVRRLRRHVPLLRNQPPPAMHTFHYDVGLDIRKTELYRFADERVDAIYLQHVRHILPVKDIAALYAHYRLPLVWMLHSMAPFTGGCNYTLGCKRYTGLCGACPQLRSTDETDLSRTIWLRKSRYLRELPLTFVAPGREVARAAARSSLLSDHRIEFIPNPVDARVYQPVHPGLARKLLGLPTEARIVATAAVGWNNWFKGSDLLVEALQRLAAEDDSLQNLPVFVAVAGSGGEKLLESVPFPGKALGKLSDEVAMALLYQSADVFVCSSRAETGPQTIPESLLCGTPVVSFPVGSALDLLTDETGYVARADDTTDLAAGIAEVLGWKGREGLSERCRAVGVAHSYERVVAAHVRLCESLLS